MESCKIAVFEVSSEYGHFRKFNTTSSPLTYPIPTKLALSGILGAILGVERELAPGLFRKGVVPVNELFASPKARFAIQLINPVKKVNIGFNLLDTGKSPASFFNIKNRTQIEFELLKYPHYRIFFAHQDEQLLEQVAERIQNKHHHFTPYLGLSQFTATVEWKTLAEVTAKETIVDYVDIHSAVNLSKLTQENPIKFGSALYSSDTFPMAMKRDRTVTEYQEILIERNTQPISVKSETYWPTPYGNILFL